jgi:hypothetical protein
MALSFNLKVIQHMASQRFIWSEEGALKGPHAVS